MRVAEGPVCSDKPIGIRNGKIHTKVLCTLSDSHSLIRLIKSIYELKFRNSSSRKHRQHVTVLCVHMTWSFFRQAC